MQKGFFLLIFLFDYQKPLLEVNLFSIRGLIFYIYIISEILNGPNNTFFIDAKSYFIWVLGFSGVLVSERNYNLYGSRLK